MQIIDVFLVFGSGLFSCRCVPWLVGCLFVYLFVFLSWAWLGMGFAYAVLPTPPLSVGAGLGNNRATHLWHRTRFPSCRLGFLCSSCHLPSYFFFCFFFVFTFQFSLHLPPPLPPVAGDMAMILRLTIPSCPFKATSSFNCFLRTLPDSLPCRSDVWE